MGVFKPMSDFEFHSGHAAIDAPMHEANAELVKAGWEYKGQRGFGHFYQHPDRPNEKVLVSPAYERVDIKYYKTDRKGPPDLSSPMESIRSMGLDRI